MAKAASKKTTSRSGSRTTARSGQKASGTEVRGLRAAKENEQFAVGRWMIIKKIDEAWDKNAGSREEVIDIKAMEPGRVPELAGIADGSNENAGNYSVELAPDGVQIGMRRGGPFEQVAGFGWIDAADKQAKGGTGSGATRVADATPA
jgi:hypothetical protein